MEVDIARWVEEGNRSATVETTRMELSRSSRPPPPRSVISHGASKGWTGLSLELRRDFSRVNVSTILTRSRSGIHANARRCRTLLPTSSPHRINEDQGPSLLCQTRPQGLHLDSKIVLPLLPWRPFPLPISTVDADGTQRLSDFRLGQHQI